MESATWIMGLTAKVQQAAQAAGMDTQAFCDRNYKTFEVRFLISQGPF